MQRQSPLTEAQINARSKWLLGFGLVSLLTWPGVHTAFFLINPLDDLAISFWVGVACYFFAAITGFGSLLSDTKRWGDPPGLRTTLASVLLAGALGGVSYFVLMLIFIGLMTITLGFALPLGVLVFLVPPAIAFASPFLIMSLHPNTLKRRILEERCLHCSYPIDHAFPVCPECGRPSL